MTNGITLYDTIANDQFPQGAAAYAAYVDGGLANQPNYAYITTQFPQAQHLSIAGDPAHDAMALDVENGDAAPGDVPGWHQRQVKRGVARPVIYASAWTMQAQVLPALADADIERSATRLWVAHYTYSPHICGPRSCGALDIDADGCQWTPNAVIDGKARDLDCSLLQPGFFGELPKDWTYGPPLALSATGGHTSARLQWQPPQGYPELPAAYRVWIYRGTRADKSTLVASYPRDAVDGALSWQGGGLERGRLYVAHVAAMGVDGQRMRPYGFSSALFMTG